MSKITLRMDVTLDMFIAGPLGDKSWVVKDHVDFNSFYYEQGALIMGRKTFIELLEDANWPYQNKDVVVLSSTDIDEIMPVGVTVYSGELLPLLDTLKKRHDSIWLVGGGLTAKTFLEGGLLDELILNVHPILLGQGIPLFRSLRMKKLKLIEEKGSENGIVQLKYKIEE